MSKWLLLCTTFVALFLAFPSGATSLPCSPTGAADQRRVLALQPGVPRPDDQRRHRLGGGLLRALRHGPRDGGEARPGPVYTLPLVLFGVFRYLYLCYQRPGHANPTEDVLTDPPFLINFALWAGLVLAVLYAG